MELNIKLKSGEVRTLELPKNDPMQMNNILMSLYYSLQGNSDINVYDHKNQEPLRISYNDIYSFELIL